MYYDLIIPGTPFYRTDGGWCHHNGGKTMLVEESLKISGLPYVSVNATAYSETGFAGLDLPQMLLGFMGQPWRESGDRLKDHRPLMEKWGVVVIDEIDKWRYQLNLKERQVGRALQAGLLKLVEGETAIVKRGDNDPGVPFRTHNLLFIGVGAFEGIEHIVRQDFTSIQDGEMHRLINTDHIARYGFMEELVGRFSTIISLPDPNTHTMTKILMEHYWPKWQQMFEDDGMELVCDEYTLRDIGNLAAQQRIGARALDPILHNLTWKARAEAKGNRIVINHLSLMGGNAHLEEMELAQA